MTGKKYGRLTAIRYLKSAGRAYWEFQCSCGNKKVIRGAHVRSGKTVSCGCYRDEMVGRIRIKHGHTINGNMRPEYGVWRSMKSRCLNKNNLKFKDYGGRGISVCPMWLNSYSNFIRDMGRRPDGTFRIERVNNNGNYEPGNCIWATQTTQTNNTRRNRFISIWGRNQTLAQWVRELGFSRWKLKDYILSRKMKPEDAVALIQRGGLRPDRRREPQMG